MAASLDATGVSNYDKINVQQDNDGTAALPAITFGGDQDTGFYSTAAGEILATTAGTLRATINATGLTVVGSVVIGSAALTEAELELLDGITAGTAAASKAVVLDSSGEIDTFAFTGGVSLGTGDLGTLKVAQTSITAAQTRTLAATPITIVPAPASGYYNVPVAVLLELDFGTIAHDDAASDGNLVVRYTNGAGAAWAFAEADAFVDAAADAALLIPGSNADVAGANGNVPFIPVVDAVIVLDNDGAEYTGTGDSTIDVTVYYVELKSML